jgi:creatinine amidohydrolase
MNWEDLSSAEFEAGVKKSEGVCVLPIAVLEKHGDHLPLGTDMFIVTETAKAAAALTPVMLFPYYFMGQISEARHVKGTIAPSHSLIMDALLEMCDEIHRNGFQKILILSGHGGNEHFLPFFAQMFTGINRPYAVYKYFVHNLTDEQVTSILSHCGADDLGEHAGFSETALIKHLRPDLVNMDKVKLEESKSLGRLDAVKKTGAYTGFDWYADYPHHFAGDPSHATAEHGKYIFNIIRDNVVNVLSEIKKDDVSPALIEEYNDLAF